ncbi:class I SAM-dependent methyltransferase [uncultured Aquimarina sp.]|uniref:class I SAM-dependent methyltransferase n=1 Tax=uncultured Aquimarina sp. TaxID=575652 RepID=UPI00261954AF|nr:class I SAM-dependent methyltransferase [uncultured Aquimarina sp.]
MKTNKESWDSRYTNEKYIFGLEPDVYLQEKENLIKSGQKVLAIGGGEGKNEIYLAKKGAEVMNVDISAVGLQKALSFADLNSVEIQTEEADLLNWNWPDSEYDIVTWFFVHFAIEDNLYILQNILKALKPGGILIGNVFSDHTGADRKGNKVITRYDEDTFKMIEPQTIGMEFKRGQRRRKPELEPDETFGFTIYKKL